MKRLYLFSFITLFFPHIDILHSVLGLPSECSHNNVIRSCTLSFSCWIQGGRHAEGCGDNTYKWLFSCCVPETEIEFNSIAHNGPVKSGYFDNDMPSRFNAMTKIKTQMKQTTPVKQNMLRRRMDDDGMVILNFLHFRWIFFSSHWSKTILFLQNQMECGIPRTAQNTIQKRIIGGRIAVGFFILKY